MSGVLIQQQTRRKIHRQVLLNSKGADFGRCPSKKTVSDVMVFHSICANCMMSIMATVHLFWKRLGLIGYILTTYSDSESES